VDFSDEVRQLPQIYCHLKFIHSIIKVISTIIQMFKLDFNEVKSSAIASSFTLIITIVIIALIIIELASFAYALFFLFLIILLILESSMSMHLSFQAFFSLIVVYQINCNQLVAL